ncbi:hypothetical protein ACSTG3_23370, partial [Vibrio parahaemolyticus]
MTGAETPSPRAAAQPTSGRTRALNVVRWTLIVIVVAAATWQLVSNWDNVAATIAQLQPHRVAIAFVAVIGGIMSS